MDDAGANRAPVQLRLAAERKPAGRFDLVSIGFHWLTLVLVSGQFALAWAIDQAPPQGAGEVLTLHRTMGLITWAVVVLRLTWRKTFAKLPPFPAFMPGWRRAAATLNEYGLYALLVLQPLTGLGDTVARGRPFQLGPWRVPALVAADKPLAHTIRELHAWGATALLALIGIHVAAALYHGLRRDGVLERMTP